MELKIVTEVYSRISGYYRPLSQWNPAKKQEKSERKEITTEGVLNAIFR